MPWMFLCDKRKIIVKLVCDIRITKCLQNLSDFLFLILTYLINLFQKWGKIPKSQVQLQAKLQSEAAKCPPQLTAIPKLILSISPDNSSKK